MSREISLVRTYVAPFPERWKARSQSGMVSSRKRSATTTSKCRLMSIARRILDEAINSFLQLLMHICNGLQVQIFVRPSFAHTARQSLDTKPMGFEKPWFDLNPKPRIPGGMKVFGRLLQRKHEIRPVIHRT